MEEMQGRGKAKFSNVKPLQKSLFYPTTAVKKVKAVFRGRDVNQTAQRRVKCRWTCPRLCYFIYYS
ncbi:hypothetical protein EYF80_012435 [Liparis tanakae]|uniref:Uncharacterized protein n=1 Tax=Liparis tanakae TaxID=230148 RepID=A0A4Z2IHW7_9TELE|nr:hypothetical protein EYF80_012435 [Liparis tanakae]